MVIAAEIPDIDVVVYFVDPVSGFAHHRGFTHSLIGIPFDALLAVGILKLYWSWRRRRKPLPAGRSLEAWEQPRWGLLFLFSCLAVAGLSSLRYQNQEPVRVSAYPYWINPFQWFGVVETKDFFALVPVDSAAGEIDPQGRMRVRYKPPETPVTLAAKSSHLGQVYLDWAQYPLLEVEQPGTA